MGSAPIALAVDRLANTILVANQLSENISLVNASDLTVVGNVSLGFEPSQLVFDPFTENAYVSGLNSGFEAINGTDFHTGGAHGGYGFDPTTLLPDPVNGDLLLGPYGLEHDQLEAVNASTGAVLGRLTVGEYPVGGAYDPSTGDLFIVNQFSDNVSVVDAASLRTVGSVAIGAEPTGVAFDPTSGRVIVSIQGNQSLWFAYSNASLIDAATLSVVASIHGVGMWTDGLVDDPSSGTVLFANEFSNNLTVVDPATGKFLGSIAVEAPGSLVGQSSSSELYDPADSSILVIQSYSDSVQVVSSSPSALIGGANILPGIAWLTVGQSASFTAYPSCLGGYCGPGVGFSWTVSESSLGTLSDAQAATATFHAMNAGSAYLVVSVSLGTETHGGSSAVLWAYASPPTAPNYATVFVLALAAGAILALLAVLFVHRRRRRQGARGPPEPPASEEAPPPPSRWA